MNDNVDILELEGLRSRLPQHCTIPKFSSLYFFDLILPVVVIAWDDSFTDIVLQRNKKTFLFNVLYTWSVMIKQTPYCCAFFVEFGPRTQNWRCSILR